MWWITCDVVSPVIDRMEILAGTGMCRDRDVPRSNVGRSGTRCWEQIFAGTLNEILARTGIL